MSSSLDILGIGLLLLIANLMLCAVLAPNFSFGNGSPGLRLRKTLRILILALVQIAAWAVMFHESGASPTPEAAGEEALRLFTFMGRSMEGLVGPWSALVPFVSLNGLLFLPISLISGFTPDVKVVTAETPAKAVETPSASVPPSAPEVVVSYEVTQEALEEESIPPQLPVAPVAASVAVPVVEKVVVQLPPSPKPVSVPAPVVRAPNVPAPAAPAASVAAPAPRAAAPVSAPAPAPAASVAAAPQGPRRGEPFRGSLPPIQLHPQAQPEMELPTFSPDRPMERIPPTPPPIRFT